MATDQNFQFMEYEAYHCLDLIAPQLDVLSWPYKWNVIHNGFNPNHFNPSLQMSKGRHKGKIQFSIELRSKQQPHIPKWETLYQKNEIGGKYLQKHWVQLIPQHFWSQHSTFSNVAKLEDRRERDKNKRTKQLKGWGRSWEGDIYIPKSSTRTSGHEMQKIKNQQLTPGETQEVKSGGHYIKKGKTLVVGRFKNGNESGCDEASSGAILCRGHGNCSDCDWHCDCGSCCGCHGYGSVIFHNLGCEDHLISHECKQSLPGRHKKTWHWKGDIPAHGGNSKEGNEVSGARSHRSHFLNYSPQHRK